MEKEKAVRLVSTKQAFLPNLSGEITLHKFHGVQEFRGREYRVLFECINTGNIRQWGSVYLGSKDV